MRTLSLVEFGRFRRSDVPAKALRDLQALDERRSRIFGEPVFEWDHLHHVVAKSFVGVVQVPGLRVQVLPKIDAHPGRNEGAYDEGGCLRARAQSNLLYMLSLTRNIPILPRELASLRIARMPLLETLIRAFAQRLAGELRRGLDHAYVHREDNGSFFRGKLLVSQHIRYNSAQRQRCYVGFEEFIADTWLNRILKAACRCLLGLCCRVGTQQPLREALLLLADVEGCVIRPDDFQRVQLNRNTERFEPLLDFAWMAIFGQTPVPAAGRQDSFSLLFPMEKLFEEFVARFIQRYSGEVGLDRDRIHVQASNSRKWLLTTESGQGRFRLKPDIVIDAPGGGCELIVDTKWKRPLSDQEDSRNGVAQTDLYQLYAYAHRYDSPDNLLLYPRVEGVSGKTYRVAGDERSRRLLRTAFIDVSSDLVRDRSFLVTDICRALRGGLPPSGGVPCV